MSHIFISYSRQQEGYAHRFADYLTQHGFDVWIDDRIDYGEDWWNAIVAAIRGCAAFTVIMTPDAEQSRWVQREIGLALRWEKPVFPLLRVGENFPLFVWTQYVDVQDGQLPPTDFIARLSEVIAPSSTPGQNVATQPSPTAGNIAIELPKDQAVQRAVKQRRPLIRVILLLGAVAILLGVGFAVGSFINRPTAVSLSPTQADAVATLAASVTDTGQTSVTEVATATEAPTDMSVEPADLTATSAVPATQTTPATASFTETPAPSVAASAAATETPNTQETATVDAMVALTDTAEAAASSTSLSPPSALAPTNIPTITANQQWKPVVQSFDGVAMVFVPPGCFMMGSASGGDDERPTANICFDRPFWIDQYEVTNAQFKQFNGQAEQQSTYPGENRPREQITWFEARNFCAGRGGRLPTEGEWEYAARGPDSLIYPWGNTLVADNVVYSGNAKGQSANVGSKLSGASWVGALDMSGNVWEWVSTLYKPYPYSATDGRESSDDTTGRRVLRGGSWYGDAVTGDFYVRAPVRYSYRPSEVYSYLGFRCARSQ